jgi:hypothetical protein
MNTMDILIILLGCLFYTDGGKSVAKVKSEIVEKQRMPAPTILVLKPTPAVNGENGTTVEEQNSAAKQTEPVASQLQGNSGSSMHESGNATVKTTTPSVTTIISK